MSFLQNMKELHLKHIDVSLKCPKCIEPVLDKLTTHQIVSQGLALNATAGTNVITGILQDVGRRYTDLGHVLGDDVEAAPLLHNHP